MSHTNGITISSPLWNATLMPRKYEIMNLKRACKTLTGRLVRLLWCKIWAYQRLFRTFKIKLLVVKFNWQSLKIHLKKQKSWVNFEHKHQWLWRCCRIAAQTPIVDDNASIKAPLSTLNAEKLTGCLLWSTHLSRLLPSWIIYQDW